MRKISVSNPKRRNSSYDNDHEPVKASIDQSERQYLSPQASPQPKPSFTITQTAEKSKHGFFSEFEIVKPPKLQSNYSLQQCMHAFELCAFCQSKNNLHLIHIILL